VRFLAELALIGGVAWLGVRLGGDVAVSVVQAVVGVAAVCVVWGVLMAPRAPRRLPDPARLIVEIVLFGGTGAAIATTGAVLAGVIGGAVSIATAVLARKFAPES
jgi:hypothetical protein